jgi:hypothetical protein
MAIFSNDVYGVQEFCDRFLGFCPIVNKDKKELEKILDENKIKYKIFPLSEVKSLLNTYNSFEFTFLIDTSYIDDTTGFLISEYKWVVLLD